jgi:hypothetical protein
MLFLWVKQWYWHFRVMSARDAFTSFDLGSARHTDLCASG